MLALVVQTETTHKNPLDTLHSRSTLSRQSDPLHTGNTRTRNHRAHNTFGTREAHSHPLNALNRRCGCVESTLPAFSLAWWHPSPVSSHGWFCKRHSQHGRHSNVGWRWSAWRFPHRLNPDTPHFAAPLVDRIILCVYVCEYSIGGRVGESSVIRSIARKAKANCTQTCSRGGLPLQRHRATFIDACMHTRISAHFQCAFFEWHCRST
jgi:hypothetical protein